jgi:general stress protein 26
MQIRHKVLQMLESFDTAMMITHAGSGPLDCRPMHVAGLEVERGGPIWFLTSVESRKVVEIARDPTTLLVFQERDRALSVWGHARVINDRDQLLRLWREPYRAWFPEGVNDPDIRLIAVEPHSAEFWDHAGADAVGYQFDARAAAAESAATRGDAEHGRTNL